MIHQEFNILLIDDDEDDYVFLKDLCREIPRSQYNMVWKSTYQDGLEAFESQRFDVCLLDYRLGEHTGLDLLKQVQNLGIVCPIIILTGQSDFDLDVQAMQMGAAEYLVKGQLTAPLLERSVRYTMKHAFDMQELKETKAQILQQDRLASLGLLASSLAHEIGTPMGIIRSRAEMILKKTSEEFSKEGLNSIIGQIDRITKLVNSLLNLARPKKSELAGPIHLNAAIHDVLNLVKHEMSRHEIQFELHIPEYVIVQAENGPLCQVLLNLLVNSIHAIQEAQAHRAPEKHLIVLSVKSIGSEVDISIVDTGCGISPQNLKQLFQAFFTTKEIGHGSGLGLATSYKIVQSWRGQIRVQSKIDKGSHFTLVLRNAKSSTH